MTPTPTRGRSFLAEVTVQNPMMVEFKRRSRRFLHGGDAKWLTLGWFLLALAMYLPLTSLLSQLDTPMVATTIVCVKLVILGLLIPILGHGVICGERDRRTWEALLSAPVSNPQLVVGKFVGSLAIIAIGFVVAAPLELIGLAIAKMNWVVILMYLRYNFFAASFLTFEAAVVFFLSARASRPMIAFGTTLGAVLTYIAACFCADATLASTSAAISAALAPINPVSVSRFFFEFHNMNIDRWAAFPFIPELGSALFLGLTAAMLVYSEKTILFADKEIPFLPKKRNA